jgi:hypothetical protein
MKQRQSRRRFEFECTAHAISGARLTCGPRSIARGRTIVVLIEGFIAKSVSELTMMTSYILVKLLLNSLQSIQS